MFLEAQGRGQPLFTESRRYERRTKKGERLSHVYLPLYPYIFKGVSLAVSVGGSKYLIFSWVTSVWFSVKASGPCAYISDFTCSQKRAPLLAEWLVWQRFQCGGLRLPLPLWWYALRASIKSSNHENRVQIQAWVACQTTCSALPFA